MLDSGVRNGTLHHIGSNHAADEKTKMSTSKNTYRASISDGMSRNAGGEKEIVAASVALAWAQATEWTRKGDYGDKPTRVVVYLDRLTDGKWVAEDRRTISVE